MTFFLDGLIVLLIIYLFSQIMVPMIIPDELERNWIFKSKKSTDNKVKTVNKAKREFEDAKEDVIKEISRKTKEAEFLKKSIK